MRGNPGVAGNRVFPKCHNYSFLNAQPVTLQEHVSSHGNSAQLEIGVAMTGRFLVALIGGITGLALTQIASAADLPRKAPAYTTRRLSLGGRRCDIS
jgi:hypothetical protein